MVIVPLLICFLISLTSHFDLDLTIKSCIFIDWKWSGIWKLCTGYKLKSTNYCSYIICHGTKLWPVIWFWIWKSHFGCRLIAERHILKQYIPIQIDELTIILVLPFLHLIFQMFFQCFFILFLLNTILSIESSLVRWGSFKGKLINWEYGTLFNVSATCWKVYKGCSILGISNKMLAHWVFS